MNNLSTPAGGTTTTILEIQYLSTLLLDIFTEFSHTMKFFRILQKSMKTVTGQYAILPNISFPIYLNGTLIIL